MRCEGFLLASWPQTYPLSHPMSMSPVHTSFPNHTSMKVVACLLANSKILMPPLRENFEHVLSDFAPESPVQRPSEHW